MLSVRLLAVLFFVFEPRQIAEFPRYRRENENPPHVSLLESCSSSLNVRSLDYSMKRMDNDNDNRRQSVERRLLSLQLNISATERGKKICLVMVINRGKP